MLFFFSLSFRKLVHSLALLRMCVCWVFFWLFFCLFHLLLNKHSTRIRCWHCNRFKIAWRAYHNAFKFLWMVFPLISFACAHFNIQCASLWPLLCRSICVYSKCTLCWAGARTHTTFCLYYCLLVTSLLLGIISTLSANSIRKNSFIHLRMRLICVALFSISHHEWPSFFFVAAHQATKMNI